MRRLALTLLLAACSSGGQDPSGSGGASANDPPLVSGLGVSGISIYQAVKIPLLSGQSPDERPAPVIQGRPAVVRVFVQPEPAWQPREVRARLLVDPGADSPLEVTQLVTGPSWEPSLSSTLNFELPGELVSANATLSVSLHEASDAKLGEASLQARFPASGSMPLEPRSSGSALRIVLVPIQYDADGTGRLPELGEAQIALYRDALFRLYPAPLVELRVHDPLPWSTPLEPTGKGWSELLQSVLSLRNKERLADQATADEYYFGLFTPAASFDAYCAGAPSCDLGLSFVIDASEEFLRGGVGLGFPGQESAATVAHEIGHSHGRLHAPCGTFGGDEDPAFPEPGGGLGTWGYDLLSGQLFDPAGDARDFMGYCDPTWVSAYNFRALHQRMAEVSSQLGSAPSSAMSRPYRVVSVGADGALALGPALQLPGAGRGERRRVALLDAQGALRRWQEARLYRYSHASGGILVIPEPEPSDFGLRMQGRILKLR